MRWDLPSALTLSNNLLLPRRMNTTVRVMNTSADALNNLQVSANYPQELFGTESTPSFALPSGASSFAALEVNSRVVYFEKIIPVKLKLNRDCETIDQLTRFVFVPATPVSSVGLTVTIDSVALDKHPQVSLIMRAEVTETGQRVLDLSAENIILFENDRIVEEFQVKKYEPQNGGKADVCFVLDISSSMGDEIDQVQRYIGEFVDSLKHRGYDYQIALVCFSTHVDKNYSIDFIKSIAMFRLMLSRIRLWGGVEDSPGAMLYALENYHWRPDSKRTIIWVTDEPYPENIQKREPLINSLLAQGVTVHGIGPLELQTDWF
ncbi:MAG: VWA domain-containing protein, partial [candidate division KSB1 bacterium]|nr:VWA domain-containing protein [candidate division KSB1 bacterium]